MWIWVILAILLGYGLSRIFLGHPLPSQPTRQLSRGEAAFIGAAADAFYPPGGEVEPSGGEAGIPAYVDRYLGLLPGSVRLLMRLLFFLVEHATLFFPAPRPRGFRRFSALAPEQRVAVLESWRTSRFFPRRLVFTSLRAIMSMGYFASPAVLRRLRLAPYAMETPVCEADLLYPPIGAPPSAILHGPEDLTPPSDGRPLDLDGPLHPDFAEARG